MKVNCDKCESTFELALKKGLDNEVYFVCPLCNTKYISYYENYASLSIQDQINELNNKLQSNTFNKRQEILDKVLKLRKEKKRILIKLNKSKGCLI